MSYQSGNQYQTTSSLAVISLIGGIASYFILPVLGASSQLLQVEWPRKRFSLVVARLVAWEWQNGA